MFRIDTITKDWKEAGSFPAQLNLYGFWDEHSFLTKTGDLGAVLKIGGIDYESLDHAGRDYAVKRFEAALRSLDDGTRLYQILFKHNHPEIAHAQYDDPLVRAGVEQRAAFLKAKSDRLYSIEIFWVVMIDGSYRKTGLLHALSQLPKQPRSSLRDLRALFSGNKERTLLHAQIERDRLRLQHKVQSLSGQLNDLMQIELSGAEKTFRLVRRLVNFRPSKIEGAARRDTALAAQWPARHSRKLPCCHRMASGRQRKVSQRDILTPSPQSQLEDQLRLESSGPAEHRTEG
jgi:type IV secretory pathway VirB4 component